VQGRLFDPPAQRIPIYIAAGGPKSARLSGMYGDVLIADPMQLMTNPAYKDAWLAEARAAGKNPDTMPILLEHFVVIGDEDVTRAQQKGEFCIMRPPHGCCYDTTR